MLTFLHQIWRQDFFKLFDFLKKLEIYLANPKITQSWPVSTVGINPILSEPQGPGTSKLDWRYLEHNKIDRNELQIRTNSQKGTGTKMTE